MKTKKLLSGLICSIMAISATVSSLTATTASAADFNDLSQSQIVEAMGAGWNLGNQLEAAQNGVPSETAWSNPVIKKELIHTVKEAGFNSIRIPVSYLSKIGAGPDYTIDSAWLNRVKEVVDYAIDEGLYVIINMHGDGYYTVDGGWLLCAEPAEKQVEIKAKYEACWRQIANIYKDYDEHLIFESMNEEFDGKYGGQNWSAYENINAYNQIFVDTVRKTGSNNAKRWLLVPGWNTDIDQTVYPQGGYSFKIPTDNNLDSSINGKRIMVSVHYYNPWDFCGDGTNGKYSQWGKDADPSKTPSYGQTEASMETQIKKVYDKFVTQGYPVIIGEFGAINKSSSDPENNKFRAHYCKTLCELSKKYGCVPVYWDNGAVSNSFGLINRSSCKIVMPEIINSIVSVYSSADENLTRLISIVENLLEVNYTEETWSKLVTELDNAKKVSKNVSSTDAQREAAYNSLLNAMNALKQGERPSNVRPFAKNITEVTYNITSSDDLDFSYQFAGTGDVPTYTMKVSAGTNDYTVAPEGEVTSFWNLGFATLEGAQTMTVNSITINGYVFDSADLKIGNSLTSDNYNNGLVNIWQGLSGTFDSIDKSACLVIDSKKIEFCIYEVDPTLPLPTKPKPTDPEPIKPDQTKPNPTKPEPTKPSAAKPSAVPTPNKTTRNPAAVKKDKAAAKKAMKQAKLTSLKVKSKAKKKINVTWKKVKKATGYQVQVSTNKKFKKSKIIFKKDLKKTKLTIKNKKIKSKKTYFVRVRAFATYKDTNNKTIRVYSKWNKQLRKVKTK